jgi:hypothetical protein
VNGTSFCGRSTVARYGEQANKIHLTNFIYSYTASHRSNSNATQHGRTVFCKVVGPDPFVQSGTGVRKRW